ncbi:hypothetical protein EIP91_002709 [Steccherinum ochraceum]|uniref:Uncharacterized protein n=1 Tax=Steccherinum ochraceum TaxID=92696 RepID=A0A4R0RBL3_9APHY|nr:hypothetical protein EIP91_002709 [Steccherinum ochraceum]
MEPLDEAMLEYAPDGDIPMYSGNSVSGFWLSHEAAMEDDSNTVTLDSNSNHSETIEVDMEPHDQDEVMTEYEMADGELAYHGEEIADVEVLDSSAFTPAIAVQEVASIAQPLPAVLGAQVELLVEAFPPPAPVEHIPSSFEDVHAPVLTGAQVYETSADVAENQAQSVEASEPVQEASTFVGGEAPALEQSASTATPAGEDSLSSTDVPAADPGTVAEAPVNPPLVTELLEERDDDNAHAAEHGTTEEDAATEEQVAAADVPQHLEGQEQHIGDDHLEDHTEEPAENPLEISDGVYIDPPPAVLLTIVLNNEHTECSLFNQPDSSSYPQGSTDATEQQVALPLLLHANPTLYYEPLSRVFATLREESFVQDTPEFADGELVLEAYELQLAISEDNVHAPEITIHDLNDLHDRAGLQGPLRMKMRTLTPRFISRYYALREQLSRLDVGLEEQPADDSEQQYTEETHDEHQDTTHTEDNAEEWTERVEDHVDELEYGEEHHPDTAAPTESHDVEEAPHALDIPAAETADDRQSLPEESAHELATDDGAALNDESSPTEDPATRVEDATDASAAVESAPETAQAEGEVPFSSGADAEADTESQDDEQQTTEWNEHADNAEDSDPSRDEHVDQHQPELEETHEDEPTSVQDAEPSNDKSHLEAVDDAPSNELWESSEIVDGAADHDADADGEYDDDPAFNVNGDQELINYDEPPHVQSKRDDGLTSYAPPEQVNGAVSAQPLHASTSSSSEQNEFTTTTSEDDLGQQELVEFEDEPEVFQQPLQSQTSRVGAESPSASSKRTYDQFELEDGDEDEVSSASDPKRLRAV